MDYSKMGLSLIISDADSAQITGLVSVGRGFFATSSSSGTIKIWEPMNPSQIAIIKDEDAIDDMISLTTHSDVKIVYVCQKMLKCFSIKHMRSTILHTSESRITSITLNQQQPGVVSFGLANGFINDFDTNSKDMYRSANLHQGSKVTAITSRGKYLISASEDGRVIVFDSSKQQEVCSPDCSKIGISNPRCLFLMENEDTIVMGTDAGLYSVNISDTALAGKPELLG